MRRYSQLPPLPCLIAFEAVARLRSGTLAASELSITPSAVTHRIKQLEALLGISLFTRVHNELNLSAAGLEYLGVVQACLESLNRFPAKTAASKDLLKLRIASPPTFARQIVVPRLERFHRKYPGVEIVLQLSVPFVGLKAEDADIEIRFGSGHYPGLQVQAVLDEPVAPVCSPAYLAKKGPLRVPADLARADLLRCPIEPWRPWFKAAGLDLAEPSTGTQYVDVGLLVEAAISGLGIALARRRMIERWLETGVLTTLFSAVAKGEHAYYATWSNASPLQPHIVRFVDWLKADLDDTGA